MRCPSLGPHVAALLPIISACAGAAATGGPPPTIPPAATGPLAIAVVYPPEAARDTVGDTILIFSAEEDRIRSRDSAFVFGSVGRGDAHLAVNGIEVPVHRSGGWIAWLPLPSDSIARFNIRAVAGADTARATLIAPVQQPFRPPEWGAWIDTTTLAPVGMHWFPEGEGLSLSVHAASEAEVRLLLPDGKTLPFQRDTGGVAGWPGERAAGRYVAWWAGPLGPDPGHVLSPDRRPGPEDSSWAVLEVVRGVDTARARWPLQVGTVPVAPPPVVVVDDDTARTGATDGTLAGRPSPYGTYHWFFPNGTVAAVSGRSNDQVRLQLSRSTTVWVDAEGVHPLPPGTPPPSARTGTPRLRPTPAGRALHLSLPLRVPFRVDEGRRTLTLTLYGVAADMDRMHYGPADPLVTSLSFAQPQSDEAVLRLELMGPVWGYRVGWVERELVLEVRRPPAFSPGDPLLGRRIAIDPGHPPRGSTGPTGAREAAVTLAVARKTAELLAGRGAEPILTREDDAPVDLNERVPLAERAGADLLVSIHADALPDGVNPFVNHGTSAYYYHPRSVDLARSLNASLVAQFGSRDRGIARGDLAVVRGTWFPSALTEGLFMMLPDQEAVLTSDTGQWQYARGIVEGIEAYLRGFAERGR